MKKFMGALVAVLASLAMVTTVSAPAHAGVGIVRVQSATVISNSAKDYYIFTKTTTVVRVIAEFTGHKTNSVKLTRFKMCFSSSDTGAEFLLPEIHVGTTRVQKWGTLPYGSGTCGKYYNVNKTFTAKPGKEMFQIHVKHGGQQYADYLGFNR